MSKSKQRHIIALLLAFICLSGKAQTEPAFTEAWGDIDYRGNAWVTNMSRPQVPKRGLEGRHISLWASHGRYYDNDKGRWKWQRPALFCTTEDLFTQTIVVPFLMPMLENAGAVVFSPRERSWQRREVIIDNDMPRFGTRYIEVNNGKDWNTLDTVKGFALHDGSYADGENPFVAGTVRYAKATKKKNCSLISYQPALPEAGRYAVYVSYATVDKSVAEAEYTVIHQGVETTFRVNQKMGGSTWVYLGSFDFDAGSSQNNRVVLTNHSKQRKGIVTADAVRFGGGMGNIVRGGRVSGMPRCLEGARYSAQWAGAPYSVYSSKNGENDYGDDINVRSLMTNWLGGGSPFMPGLEGKKVPIELSLAVHSDAGYTPDHKQITGSLAICTTDFNDGRLNSGISRQVSRDFASMLLNNVDADMRHAFGRWNKRYLWDRNYSETRLPEVPSAIIETLSHQNFPDMRLAQDPAFKFTMARSLYKTILRFINAEHGKKSVVQPLPPQHFRVELTGKGKARLAWDATPDNNEPTAKPNSYNIYIGIGANGFDNGTSTRGNDFEVDLLPNTVYRFRVTACNDGGESFPSETLAAYYNPIATKTVLVVNGFTRLSSPAVVDTPTEEGFDLDTDMGVQYGLYAGWNGRQTAFNKARTGIESSDGLGYGGEEMAGQLFAGNDFNYSVDHTEAIASSGKYSVVSCSKSAFELGRETPADFAAIDLILGLEKNDGHSLRPAKTFSLKMQQLLTNYAMAGGAILASGAYIGSDMTAESERQFMQNIFGLTFTPNDTLTTEPLVKGLGMDFAIYRALNERHYGAQQVDVIQPAEGAICAMQYADGNSAAVGFKSAKHSSFAMGFPLECIINKQDRNKIMRGILAYLLQP